MKKLLLASVAMIALSAPALAADLAARPYTKAPVAPALVDTWTGFYIGAMGGYAWENASGPGTFKGGFAGGTVGYNWQMQNIVFGIEADGAWADVKASVTGPVAVPGFGVVSTTLSTKMDALGTVRGRLGWAVNNVLFYGTGGYAWADNKVSISALGATISDSKFLSGWTAGAGVGAFVAPQWTIKGEYLYRSFASQTYFSGALPIGSLNSHSVQVGVNYHFGGPVVAKY